MGWEEEDPGVGGESCPSLNFGSMELMGDPGTLFRMERNVWGELSSDDEDEVGGVALRIRYCRRYSATMGMMR